MLAKGAQRSIDPLLGGLPSSFLCSAAMYEASRPKILRSWLDYMI